MKERRKFSRIDKHSLLEFRELKDSHSKEGYSNSSVKDISGSGLLFEAVRKFDIGTVLHLKISLTGHTEEKLGHNMEDPISVTHPISIICKVVRVEELKKDHLYDIGIKFINFYEDDAAGFIDFLNNNL